MPGKCIDQVNPFGITGEGQYSPEGLEFSPLAQSLSY
jgi:hypothetical protein